MVQPVAAPGSAGREGARVGRSQEWLRLSSPTQQSVNLHTFALNTTDPELKILLLELDRACFSGSPWIGESLLKALPELPVTSAKRAKQRRARDHLVALYK